MGKKFKDIDWYCDECDSYLNSQPGFSDDCDSWTCTNCGYTNDIDAFSILDEDELEDYESSGCSSYNEYLEERESDESLSVHDAALIWLSNGMDEDYTMGYSEDELRDALS